MYVYDFVVVYKLYNAVHKINLKLYKKILIINKIK